MTTSASTAPLRLAHLLHAALATPASHYRQHRGVRSTLFDLPPAATRAGSLLRTLSLLPGHRESTPVQRPAPNPLVEASCCRGWDAACCCSACCVAIVAFGGYRGQRARLRDRYLRRCPSPSPTWPPTKPARHSASKFQLWGSGSLPEYVDVAGGSGCHLRHREAAPSVSPVVAEWRWSALVQHPSRVMELRLRCPGVRASPGEYVFLLTIRTSPSTFARGRLDKQVEQLYSQCYGKGDLTTASGPAAEPLIADAHVLATKPARRASLRKLKRLNFYMTSPRLARRAMDGDDVRQLLDIRGAPHGAGVETRTKPPEIAVGEAADRDALRGGPNWDLEPSDLAGKHPDHVYRDISSATGVSWPKDLNGVQ
uniref:Uncharacterized protein n=1 Tax=Macrostomum lignano TaxID=282301 RepID=A0A1I8F7X1_9PLAT